MRVPRSVHWLSEAKKSLPDIRSWRSKPGQCLEAYLVGYSQRYQAGGEETHTEINETCEDASAETTNSGRGLKSSVRKIETFRSSSD
jgi:hypothetical protein